MGFLFSTNKEGKQTHFIELKYGSLQLRTISLEKMNTKKANNVTVVCNGRRLPARLKQDAGNMVVELAESVTIQTNQLLTLTIQ